MDFKRLKEKELTDGFFFTVAAVAGAAHVGRHLHRTAVAESGVF